MIIFLSLLITSKASIIFKGICGSIKNRLKPKTKPLKPSLRNRQFIRERTWKQKSIAYRLATRVRKEIEEFEVARSKKGLTKKYINECFLIDYAQPCRIRNCLNCHNNQIVNP